MGAVVGKPTADELMMPPPDVVAAKENSPLDDTDIKLLARDGGVSIATGYRYLHEAIDVIAAHCPDLHHVLGRGLEEGWAFGCLDGTLIATTRSSAPSRVVTASGTPASTSNTAGTSTSSPIRPGSRCGSATSNPARPTTSPQPAPMSCQRCIRPLLPGCRR